MYKAFEIIYKGRNIFKKVEIHLAGVAPIGHEVHNIEGDANLFTLTYNSESKDKTQSILSTTAEINIYEDEKFNIKELATLGETDIKVIYFEGVTEVSMAQKWQGFIIPDFFQTDIATNRVISMVASDRLGVLKDIDYKGTEVEYSKIVANCLKATGIVLGFDIIPTDYLSFYEYRFNPERFNDKSFYNVLESCLLLFNLKVFQYENRWVLINKYNLENGFLDKFLYTSNGIFQGEDNATQEVITIDKIFLSGQREVKPSAMEVSINMEFGKSKKYPINYDFRNPLLNTWYISNNNDSSQVFERVSQNISGFDRSVSGEINGVVSTEAAVNNSLHIRAQGLESVNAPSPANYYQSPHIQSAIFSIPFTDVYKLKFKISANATIARRLTISPILIIRGTTTTYYLVTRNNTLKQLTSIAGDRILNFSGATFSDMTIVSGETIYSEGQFQWSQDFEVDVKQAWLEQNADIQMVLYIWGTSFNETFLGVGETDVDAYVNSITVDVIDDIDYGKGITYKVRQNTNKFSNKKELPKILFGNKVDIGINGFFYGMRSDDTSIALIPEDANRLKLLTTQVGRMLGKTRDFYSIDGTFKVNPLAKYQINCDGDIKNFILVGGKVGRRDSSLIIEEEGDTSVTQTNFIYTYFDEDN